MKEVTIDEAYENLANEIVRSAVLDYKHLIDHPPRSRDPHDISSYEYSKKKLLKFFYSDWYRTLTKADPDYILANIHSAGRGSKEALSA